MHEVTEAGDLVPLGVLAFEHRDASITRIAVFIDSRLVHAFTDDGPR